MRSTVKMGALLTATVVAGGVYFASSAVAGGGKTDNAKSDWVVATSNAASAFSVVVICS